MSVNRRRGRGAVSGRTDVLPSILVDTVEDSSSVILEPTNAGAGILNQNLDLPSVLEKTPRNSKNRNSMTYTQLERDIKGESQSYKESPLELMATLEREKYGTEVEIVNTLQEYFARVDPRAPKHFINACLNLVESKGPQAVDGFLRAKYGVAPFESAAEQEDNVSVSTDKNIMQSCRHLISEKISRTRNMAELTPYLIRLYELRDDLHSQDQTIVVDAMCSWTFRYGVHFLSGKLEIYYLGSVESEDQTMVEVLKTLPEVPFHDEISRRDFLERHKVEIRKPQNQQQLQEVPIAKPANLGNPKKQKKGKEKQTAVYVDEDVNLDKEEVAFLWLHVYKFYEENNYAKGLAVELIKQTENSVYYILQHGIEGFNLKVADKFGRRFMNLVFALPPQPEDDSTILKQVNKYYTIANEGIKLKAQKEGKKPSKRSFNKLIEALNFKFANAQKKKNAQQRKNRGHQGFMASFKTKARSTEKNFFKFAKKTKLKHKKDQPEKLLGKKIKLFILQSMKTPVDRVEEETYSLLKLHKKKGSRAFKTRLKINYGGQFEQIDFMTEDEIDAMIEKILDQDTQPKSKKDIAKERHNSAQFVNIYKELSFYRNPETQIRYNKV